MSVLLSLQCDPTDPHSPTRLPAKFCREKGDHVKSLPLAHSNDILLLLCDRSLKINCSGPHSLLDLLKQLQKCHSIVLTAELLDTGFYLESGVHAYISTL